MKLIIIFLLSSLKLRNNSILLYIDDDNDISMIEKITIYVLQLKPLCMLKLLLLLLLIFIVLQGL